MSERVSDEYLARIIEQRAGVMPMHLAADLRDARRERDAERAHADRLAEALRIIQRFGYEVHSPDNIDAIDAALAAHDARRGKP